MKVLHILNELRPSGAETMLRLAAPYWREIGFECEVLATGKNIGNYASTLACAGYQIHHLPIRKTPAYFHRISQFIKEGEYSIVHHHTEGMRYWFCLSALAGGAKVATTVHNNFQFNGLLRLRRALQRRHLQRLGVVFIAIATGVLQNERDRFGIQPRLAWNWFDTDQFLPIMPLERALARERFGLQMDDKVIVSLGNCSTVKNHTTILKALIHLPDVKYLHVGEEDTAYSERALAAELGVSERVNFIGWMQNPRPALAAADIYAMPSLYEGLGIAALEAIGSGVPCLLARSPGLIDLETLGLDLTYVRPEPEDIANKLQAMLRNINQQLALAQGNSSAVRERLSPRIGAAAYAAIWKDMSC